MAQPFVDDQLSLSFIRSSHQNLTKSMTMIMPFHRLAILSLAVLIVSTSVGCQSGGGSRWAWWNPMSGGTEDASLIARTSPALPSDSATPLVEGAATAPVANMVAAATTAAPTTSASTIGNSPANEAAQMAATPSLSKPAATPAVTSYPIAAIPEMKTPAALATRPVTPTTTTPGGPYNPNAYQETAPVVAAAAPASADRYGSLGNRYADTAPASTPAFNYQPEATSAPATTGDRYATYTAAAPTAPATPSYSPATQTAATQAPVATPSYPATPTAVATTPAYTPSDSRYAATTYPTTPAAVATASLATQAGGAMVANSTTQGSEVRLVSSPGGYRPGGTSTYQPSMNIATKPSSIDSPVATPAYPSSGYQYQR